MRIRTAIYMLFACLSLSAQTPFDSIYAPLAASIREEVQVFTDRSIYVVEETILFSAHQQLSGVEDATPWSTLLYIELVKPGGQPVAKGKFRFVSGEVSGSFPIPVTVFTGNYYLKCYTRWMRNTGLSSFTNVPLRIINPYHSGLVARPEGALTQTSFSKEKYKPGELECITDAFQYQARSKVQLRLKGPSNPELEYLNCCLTVVPEGAVDLVSGALILPDEDPGRDAFRVNYLPDRSAGICISGKVRDPDQVPVAFANLHFSRLGDSPDFFAAMTDENGSFVLSSSVSDGKHEFFVTPEEHEEGVLEVNIDQDFDTRVTELPAGDFQLAEGEHELARKMVLNMQLTREFGDTLKHEVRTADQGKLSDAPLPFYGSNVQQLRIDDYVDLPNLEEIFINLVPDVQLSKKGGKTRIRIISDNLSIGVYEALILIDHISVFDQEAILALSPKKIERIDLITEVYLKGNVTFGGVLAIYSKKGDMAGIDLPEGSYFFDLQSTEPERPLPGFIPHPGPRVTDTRNTIFWSDRLQLNLDRQEELSFQAPSSPGFYVVLVRGLAPNGELYAASTRFRVD